jgi:hypothetical protein
MNSRTAMLLSLFFLVSVACLHLTGSLHAAVALLSVAIALSAWVKWTRARHEQDRPAVAKLEGARQMLAEGDSFAAIQAASAAAAQAKTRRTRNASLTTLAWAALAQGHGRRAKAALDEIHPRYEIDLHCSAAVDSVNGSPDSAIRALDIARTAGILNREGAKLLVDLYARKHGLDRAVMAAVQNQQVLGAEDCRIVVKAACDAGEYGPAAILASTVFQTTGAPGDAAALLRALAFGREMSDVFRALDDVVWRLRRAVDGKAQARLLVAELEADRTLPSTARSELGRMLRVIEGPSLG